jgi:hypothetical protein
MINISGVQQLSLIKDRKLFSFSVVGTMALSGGGFQEQ